MSYPLSRRDVLKAMVATGCLAALPEGGAQAGHGDACPPGWVCGKKTGAEALVETLLQEGTCVVFGIPGAQCNEFWDTMKSKGLPYLLVTHEFCAATMADGYARATGKPGVMALVPGPGVTNALTGIGEALLDGIPLVAIVCDVARGPKAHAFQLHELPQVPLLRALTKGVFCVENVAGIPGAVHEAFNLARSGEPGPTAVVIPYPLFIDETDFHCPPPAPPAAPWDEDAFQRALHILANRGCRVGIYAGLGCMDCSPLLVQTAEVLQAPVATSISGKGAFPECHPLSVGWGYGPQATRTAEAVFKDVDIVLAIGVRYSEVSTGFYSIPEHHPLIQVDINPNNLGRNVKPDVCVVADACAFLGRLLECADLVRRPPDGRLVARIAALKREEARKNAEVYSKCGVDPMAFVLALRRYTNPDALLYVDVTECEHWASEAFTVCQPRTYFNPSNNQGMGWSIPASIGGQRAFPGRQVATITGDGCFLMTAMEISTAGRECLPVKFFVLDDQAYHIMQTLQKSAYLRTTATVLARLNYAALAQGFGVGYNEIACNDNLEAGIRGALCQHGPVLTRVVADYSDRPMRWVHAVKKRYQKELTTEQKMRFLARMGGRAIHFRDKEND
ncbi:MAG TPA: thiamine pyrophosphate-binding protein [Gemmataceae bacterium]|nr:thiamine pyrophosphate-binding protein [Gemmataceae bacterium]